MLRSADTIAFAVALGQVSAATPILKFAVLFFAAHKQRGMKVFKFKQSTWHGFFIAENIHMGFRRYVRATFTN